jgi:hypothetical protein
MQNLQWSYANSADVDYFLLSYGTDPANLNSTNYINNDQRSYQVNNLTAGTQYTFKLQARDYAGNLSSALSATAHLYTIPLLRLLMLLQLIRLPRRVLELRQVSI